MVPRRHFIQSVDSFGWSEERWFFREISLGRLILRAGRAALVVLLPIHEHLSPYRLLRLVGAVEEIAIVTQAHVPILRVPIVLCLQVIFEEVRVLEVFFTLSALVLALRHPAVLVNDDLLPHGHELVFAERALVAHAHVVLCEDRQYLLVDPVKHVRRVRQRAVVKHYLLIAQR